MMTLSSALAYALAMAIIAATPGPAFFTYTTRTMTHGFWAGVALAIGIGIADAIFVFLAVYGLGELATRFALGFTIFKILGGAYLIYLGIKLFVAKPKLSDPAPHHQPKPSRHTFWGSHIFEGLIVTLTNPKAIVFFAAFLPNFIDLTTLTTEDIIIILAITLIVGFAVVMAYVSAIAFSRTKLLNTTRATWLNRIAGVTMAAVGIAVATR